MKGMNKNMKMIDEKGKLFGVLNIVDILIIVFAVAAVSGAYVFLKKNITKSSPTRTYEITLELKNVEKDFCDSIIPGKTVFDRIQNKQFGVLNDVRIKKSTEYNVSTVDGSVVKVDVPERYNAELDMELTTDTDIYIGKYLSVATKDFTGAGYVIAVEKPE